MDTELAELKAAIDAYKSQPAKADAVGALDWAALLTIVPVVLRLFVRDEALRAVLEQIISLLSNLFKK